MKQRPKTQRGRQRRAALAAAKTQTFHTRPAASPAAALPARAGQRLPLSLRRLPTLLKRIAGAADPFEVPNDKHGPMRLQRLYRGVRKRLAALIGPRNRLAAWQRQPR